MFFLSKSQVCLGKSTTRFWNPIPQGQLELVDCGVAPVWIKDIPWIYTHPSRIPVTNAGLGRNSLVKMSCHPGGDWHPGWVIPRCISFLLKGFLCP